MNRFLIVFLTSIFFYPNISALTIVAKVNPKDNSLYLEEDDPHRKNIIAILQKYQWPMSLIQCTDEERHEIFKDTVPFAETDFIQKKIREVTGDNSYIAIWIPPMISQGYMMLLFLRREMFDGVYQEGWGFIPDDFSKKDQSDNQTFFDPAYKRMNDFLCNFNKEGIPYLWHYNKHLLDDLKDSFDDFNILPSNKAISFCRDIFKNMSFLFQDNQNILSEKNVFLAGQELYPAFDSYDLRTRGFNLEILTKKDDLSMYVAQSNILSDGIKKEYEAAQQNKSLFSRASNILSIKRDTVVSSEITELIKKQDLEFIFLPINPYSTDQEQNERSTSFALRHLDLFLYNTQGCSLALSVLFNEPIFYFNTQLESSREQLYKQGCVVPPTHELLAPFLYGEFPHGRFAISTCYIEFSKEYMQNEGILPSFNGHHSCNTLSTLEHYMMPRCNRLPFHKDSILQKIFYMYMLASTVGNTLDIKRIDSQKALIIKNNQRDLIDLYRRLFIKRIQELTSPATKISKSDDSANLVIKKNVLSINRLSAVSKHVNPAIKNNEIKKKKISDSNENFLTTKVSILPFLVAASFVIYKKYFNQSIQS